jgi:hypothetical protein
MLGHLRRRVPELMLDGGYVYALLREACGKAGTELVEPNARQPLELD